MSWKSIYYKMCVGTVDYPIPYQIYFIGNCAAVLNNGQKYKYGVAPNHECCKKPSN